VTTTAAATAEGPGACYKAGMLADADPRQLVAGPATGLIVSSIVWIVLLVAGIGFSAFLLASDVADALPDPSYVDKRTQIMVRMGIAVVLLFANVLTLAGARQMRRLERYSMARTAAILAVIPCTSACYIVGVPFGIWALTVLGKPDVRGAFRS
jgi:hypothetical protein